MHNEPRTTPPPPFTVRATASAPTRTADAGGWTDTWFAMEGSVCNIAIDHRAEVVVTAQPSSERIVRLLVHMTDEDYVFDAANPPGRHPIIEHAIVDADVPGAVVVDIADSIAAGSGLGTSASVMVALVAGLAAVVGDPLDAGEIAVAAHRLETVSGKQSGVQDHAAAAWGGVSRFDVKYPHVRHVPIHVPAAAFDELTRRLHTVYLGAPHVSGRLHEQVIARLDDGGGRDELEAMRRAAVDAADALVAGDLAAYGRALVRCHGAIGDLHPDLIGGAAVRLEAMAREHGAVGWKVNGAGGDGGSMVVLGPADPAADAALVAAIAEVPGWRRIEGALGAEGVRTRTVMEDGAGDGGSA